MTRALLEAVASGVVSTVYDIQRCVCKCAGGWVRGWVGAGGGKYAFFLAIFLGFVFFCFSCRFPLQFFFADFIFFPVVRLFGKK